MASLLKVAYQTTTINRWFHLELPNVACQLSRRFSEPYLTAFQKKNKQLGFSVAFDQKNKPSHWFWPESAHQKAIQNQLRRK
jgi:hypothetical protein